MLELMALGVIVAVLFAGFAGLVVVLTFVKLAVRLVLWPLLLIKWIVFSILFVVIGPILFIAGLVVSFAVGAALLVPLLPFLAVAFLVWLLVRANHSSASELKTLTRPTS